MWRGTDRIYWILLDLFIFKFILYTCHVREFRLFGLGSADDSKKIFFDRNFRSTIARTDSSTSFRSQRMVFSAHYTKSILGLTIKIMLLSRIKIIMCLFV